MHMIENLFQTYSIKCGLTPVSCWTLYTIFYTDKVYAQNNIAELWHFPKQTVNFAIRKLVEEDYLYLEPLPNTKRSKGIYLTEKGKTFCQKIIQPLISAELNALNKFCLEEREQLLSLNQKYYSFLKEEIESIYHSNLPNKS